MIILVMIAAISYMKSIVDRIEAVSWFLPKSLLWRLHLGLSKCGGLNLTVVGGMPHENVVTFSFRFSIADYSSATINFHKPIKGSVHALCCLRRIGMGKGDGFCRQNRTYLPASLMAGAKMLQSANSCSGGGPES